MDQNRPIEQLLRQINTMSRRRCIDELVHFQEIPLDFDRESLKHMSVERLRHILTAAVLTVHQRRRAG